MSRNYKIHNPDGIYFLTFTVVGWIDVFTRIEYKNIIIDSFKYCQKEKGLKIYAYVIMTNHIHLIAKADNGNLIAIIRDIKKFTSGTIIKAIAENIKESRKKWMLNYFSYKGKKNSNNKIFQFWQQHNKPIELISPKMLKRYINYIHYNPVKAGFVERPEDYLYSSAKNYAGEKGILDVEVLIF